MKKFKKHIVSILVASLAVTVLPGCTDYLDKAP